MLALPPGAAAAVSHNLIQMQPSPPLSPLPPALRAVEVKGRMYHNAVYYRHDGRSPAKVLEPQITSIVYYSTILFDDHGRIFLANPGLDTRDNIDGVDGGILRACTNMKRLNSQLKIVLSLEAQSETLFQRLLIVARDPAKRRTFALSARQLIDRNGLDGIDLDWGHPATHEEGHDLQNLLIELRSRLQSPTYWISVALSADEWNLTYLQVSEISTLVDLFNVKCFDFIADDSSLTGHASPLFGSDNHYFNYGEATNCHALLRKLEAHGVPLMKVMLCISALAYVFHGARGPGQPFERIDRMPYHQMPLEGSAEIEDAELGLAYCVDEKQARYVSYDNRLTVEMKANYVRQNGLAGVALKWANYDVREEGLVNAAYRALHPLHSGL